MSDKATLLDIAARDRMGRFACAIVDESAGAGYGCGMTDARHRPDGDRETLPRRPPWVTAPRTEAP